MSPVLHSAAKALLESDPEAVSMAVKRFRLRDSRRLIVERMRDGVNGSYTIDTATHTFTKSEGLMTTLLCKPGEGPAEIDS